VLTAFVLLASAKLEQKFIPAKFFGGNFKENVIFQKFMGPTDEF